MYCRVLNSFILCWNVDTATWPSSVQSFCLWFSYNTLSALSCFFKSVIPRSNIWVMITTRVKFILNGALAYLLSRVYILQGQTKFYYIFYLILSRQFHSACVYKMVCTGLDEFKYAIFLVYKLGLSMLWFNIISIDLNAIYYLSLNIFDHIYKKDNI